MLLPDLHTDFSRGRSGGLVFPSLEEFSTMTRLSWVTLYGLVHNFIELGQAVVHVISLVSFSVIVTFCLPSDG